MRNTKPVKRAKVSRGRKAIDAPIVNQSPDEDKPSTPYSRMFERRVAATTALRSNREASLDAANIAGIAQSEQFILAVKDMVTLSHEIARANGFWDKDTNVTHSQKLLLIVSEVIEAMNVMRKSETAKDEPIAIDSKQTHIVVDSEFLEELADIVIRVFDLAGRFGNHDWFATILVDKLIENTQRPYRHNRNF